MPRRIRNTKQIKPVHYKDQLKGFIINWNIIVPEIYLLAHIFEKAYGLQVHFTNEILLNNTKQPLLFKMVILGRETDDVPFFSNMVRQFNSELFQIQSMENDIKKVTIKLFDFYRNALKIIGMEILYNMTDGINGFKFNIPVLSKNIDGDVWQNYDPSLDMTVTILYQSKAIEDKVRRVSLDIYNQYITALIHLNKDAFKIDNAFSDLFDIGIIQLDDNSRCSIIIINNNNYIPLLTEFQNINNNIIPDSDKGALPSYKDFLK